MKKPLPPLRRIHTNDTLESGASNFSLEYWRQRKTEDIIECLYVRGSSSHANP